jgi:hypothetical protein
MRISYVPLLLYAPVIEECIDLDQPNSLATAVVSAHPA